MNDNKFKMNLTKFPNNFHWYRMRKYDEYSFEFVNDLFPIQQAQLQDEKSRLNNEISVLKNQLDNNNKDKV